MFMGANSRPMALTSEEAMRMRDDYHSFRSSTAVIMTLYPGLLLCMLWYSSVPQAGAGVAGEALAALAVPRCVGQPFGSPPAGFLAHLLLTLRNSKAHLLSLFTVGGRADRPQLLAIAGILGPVDLRGCCCSLYLPPKSVPWCLRYWQPTCRFPSAPSPSQAMGPF